MMAFRLSFWVLVGAIFWPAPLWAEPVPSPSLLPSVAIVWVGQPQDGKFQVGDRIEFRLEGLPEEVLRGNIELRGPDTTKSLMDVGLAFEWEPARGRGVLIPVKGGMLSIPALTLWVKHQDQDTQIGWTLATNLEVAEWVTSQTEEQKKPEPLLPPAELPLPVLLVIVIAIAVLLLVVGAVVAAMILWKKWKQRRARRTPGRLLTEDQEALEDLRKLKLEGLLAKAKVKIYHYRLSEILKRYLSKRFDFEALESTSSEVVARLEVLKLTDDRVIDRIEKLFEALDLAKFTDHRPSIEESEKSLEELAAIVRATRKERGEPV